MKIKTKAGIREALMKGEDYDDAMIRMEATSMANGGVIRWWWNPVKEIVESFGRGPGWCDQGVSEHDLEDAVDYLWKQRKYILREVD
ncbi:MAG: hypothetical protein M0Q16_10025 [Candidatus Cloacimonetes bacterium]|jgi:hypothetical protein|nr:hypothetical protein [Candidatus Cloacimonadota bacterium]